MTFLDLTHYDAITISSSAGKDSAAMLAHVVALADEQGVDRSKLHVLHADLGRMEWVGTGELAAKQAAHYGLDFRVVQKEGENILEQAERLKHFPTKSTRFCTSDHKRDQLAKARTQIANEIREASPDVFKKHGRDKRPGVRAVRVLACIGMRAQESSGRSKLAPFEPNYKRETSGLKVVDNWLPIHTWTVEEVWAGIKAAGLPSHYAYELGMPRLSCVFCIFAPKSALLIAGKHNRELLEEFVAVEKRIGHTFKNGLALATIQAELNAGVEAGPVGEEDASCWTM